MRFWILAGALAMPGVASATTGLEWRLPEEGARYLVGARLQLPEVMMILGENNLEVRVTEFRQQAVATCTPESAAGKKGWNVVCALDAVSLQATTHSNDRGRAAPIMEEWSAAMTGASAQFVLLRDGRIRSIDLEGVTGDDRRTNEIAERMTELATRAFVAFDLELPKKGDDRGESWKQRNPPLFGFVSDQGALGSGAAVHRVTGSEGSVVTIETEGDGTFSTGITSVRGQERPANTFEMTVTGTAAFDTERGLLVQRVYRVQGDPTPSSVIVQSGAGYPYVQEISLRLLEGDPPELPDPGELGEGG